MLAIKNNAMADNAARFLGQSYDALAQSVERLSSGLRINSAADDPAGMTIAAKLNARSEGMKTALSNIGDAKNLLSVAESGLSKINGILTKMRNLAQQGISDTLGDDERTAIQTQLKEYESQIDDTIGQTTWNGDNLVSTSSSMTFQTGANSGDTTSFSAVKLVSVTATTNGLNVSSGALSSAAGSTFGTYMASVDAAMDTISEKLSNVGSLISKLTFKEEQLGLSGQC